MMVIIFNFENLVIVEKSKNYLEFEYLIISNSPPSRTFAQSLESLRYRDYTVLQNPNKLPKVFKFTLSFTKSE